MLNKALERSLRQIQALSVCLPDAVRLARLLSLAVRAEPDLVRAARIAARLDTNAEADLWFSGLVAASGPLGIALEPSAAEILRVQLTEEERRLAWDLVKQHHGEAPWSIRLEERINYLSTAGGTEGEIEELLTAALVELRDLRSTDETGTVGIARWLLAASARLPSGVRGSSTAAVARVAAGVALDGRVNALAELSDQQRDDWLPWLFANLGTTSLPVRLFDGRVVFGGNATAAVPLPVPTTDPLVLEVTWSGSVGEQKAEVRLRPEDEHSLEVGGRRVAIRTIAGVEVTLEVAAVGRLMAEGNDLGGGCVIRPRLLVCAAAAAAGGPDLAYLPQGGSPIVASHAVGNAGTDLAFVSLATPAPAVATLREPAIGMRWRLADGRGGGRVSDVGRHQMTLSADEPVTAEAGTPVILEEPWGTVIGMIPANARSARRIRASRIVSATRRPEKRRPLIYVSYAREDADWLRRFEVMLKPLVRHREIDLWHDVRLAADDRWVDELEDAITRADIALLLVTPDFLASDFIMDRELPALIERGAALAPVLVRACRYDHVEALTGVQWALDPTRDGPLAQATDVNGAIVQAVRAVVALVDTAAGMDERATPSDGVDQSGHTPPEPALIDSGQEGTLNGVPEMPPGYVARDEHHALRDALLGAGDGTLSLARGRQLGLHGQGGIGKTVLAVALARDPVVRRYFPDGIFWVTLGENADLVQAQIDLLERLGGFDDAVRSMLDGLNALRDALDGRRCLLVVDDVWTVAGAQAFDAIGSTGRVLYTTRDPATLSEVGAEERHIDVLSERSAKQLLATLTTSTVEELPDDVDRVLLATGRIPLALALVASAVGRGGRSWRDVADELERVGVTFLEHPYANMFKAMGVAVTALDGEIVAAYETLAVYPEDTPVPVAAVARLWNHMFGLTLAQTQERLQLLASRALISVDKEAITLHDLQRNFLLLRVESLRLLHHELVEAYRALLPSPQSPWRSLPDDEPYIWEHLVEHLIGTGEALATREFAADLMHIGESNVSDGALEQATVWLERSCVAWRQLRDRTAEAAACRRLGDVLEERGDLQLAAGNAEEAMHMHARALEVRERVAAGEPDRDDYQRDIAISCDRVGNLQEQHRDYDVAEARYRQSLEIWQRLGDQSAMAKSHRSIGKLAKLRGDLDAADARFRQSLEISERLDEQAGMAATSGELAALARARGDVVEAEAFYRRALELRERVGDEAGVAATSGELAALARARGDVVEAEAFYRRALELRERVGDEAGVAATSGELAALARARGDVVEAEAFYRRALELRERVGDEAGVAATSGELAALARARGDVVEAEAFYRRALELRERVGDEAGVAATSGELAALARARGDVVEAEAFYRRALELRERVGDEAGVAATSGELAALARARGDVVEAETFYRRALELRERAGDNAAVAAIYSELAKLAEARGDIAETEELYLRGLDFRVQPAEDVGTPIPAPRSGIDFVAPSAFARFNPNGVLPTTERAYVVRQFERETFEQLSAGRWVLLLGPRKCGKSSALWRIRSRLEESGYSCATIDLQSYGGQDENYAGFLEWFADSLAAELGVSFVRPPKRQRNQLKSWLRKVVRSELGTTAIFIDEAGGVPSRFRTPFFSQLRAFFGRRGQGGSPAGQVATRVVFAFAGTLLPARLIDSDNSPFNVAFERTAGDLTSAEVAELAALGLGGDAAHYAQRAFAETHGQPYYVQHLLAAVQSAGDDPALRSAAFDAALRELQQGAHGHLEDLTRMVEKDEGLRALVPRILDGNLSFDPGSSVHRYAIIAGVARYPAGLLVAPNPIDAAALARFAGEGLS